MSTQAERLVRIESPTGAQVTVIEADYKHKKMAALRGQTYEECWLQGSLVRGWHRV
jgi:hypothetical protein